jgi:phospholipid N-methyltransferase
MPYSSGVFDSDVEGFLQTHSARYYLDLGPGYGKYGRMIRRVNDSAVIAAIECDEDYVSRFDLEHIYDVVHRGRLEMTPDEFPDLTCDIVIVGDVIEHLKKSDGLDLLNYLMYRCRYCLIVYPHKYLQYSWRGRAAEAHRSVWREADFEQFDATVVSRDATGLAIISGFIGDPAARYDGDFQTPRPLAGLL